MRAIVAGTAPFCRIILSTALARLQITGCWSLTIIREEDSIAGVTELQVLWVWHSMGEYRTLESNNRLVEKDSVANLFSHNEIACPIASLPC